MGVPEYWIVDPTAKRLSIFVLASDGNYLQVELLHGRLRSTVFPDLEIDLSAIFAGMPDFDEE